MHRLFTRWSLCPKFHLFTFIIVQSGKKRASQIWKHAFNENQGAYWLSTQKAKFGRNQQGFFPSLIWVAVPAKFGNIGFSHTEII